MITNGLLVYLDAKNNTGTGSHDANASTWADLSGNNNNGTLHNCEWDGDSLYFDGSSSWVGIGEINQSKISIDVLVKFAVQSSDEKDILTNFEGGGYGILLNYPKIGCSVHSSGKYNTFRTNDLVDDTIYHISMTYDGTAVKLYIDGGFYSQIEASGNITTPLSNTILALGANPYGNTVKGGYFRGNIMSARVYNRALSADEVLENYQYDHSRYIDSKKYLIRDGKTIYTVTDGTLSVVEGDLTANLFISSGVDAIPDGALLITLRNPEVLCWTDAETLPTLTATVKGIPQPQLIVSEEINLMDGSIKGIDSVAIDCKGEPIFAVSFDKKATWIMHNGTEWVAVSDKLAGMTKTEFEAITTEQWQAQYEVSSDMYIRCTLLDETQSVTTVSVGFVN